MEFSREIYWNIGNGASVLAPMYAFTAAAIAVLLWGFWQRIKVYRRGRSLDRTDNLGVRIVNYAKSMLFQSRILRVPGPGIAHALFFWGFLVLFAGTCLIVVQEDITAPFFNFRFLAGNFYKIFSVALDVAGLLAIVMLGGLFVRRYLVRATGLKTKTDDAVMHCLLLAILVSGFFIEGARIAVTELGTPLATWSPVGQALARSMTEMSEESLLNIHTFTWWLHLFLVIVFIMLIPFTKLRHIFTTSGNILFAPRGPKGQLTTLDLEDEEAESFGAAHIAEMSWKDIFDADACTQCKRCQDRCPAHNTDKPLSPMNIVNQIGVVAFETPEADLVETCEAEALWSCTTCLACEDICPAGIEHVGKIVNMRRSMALMKGEFAGQEVMAALDQVEVNGNPFGIGYASRGDWTEGLPVVTLEQDTDVDILYFVGCYASFDQRNIEIAKNFVRICAAAGIKVGILGKEEKCCGEPVRKLGNEYLYQALATENIKMIEEYGISKVVTSCPHCFNTLTNDYRDLGFGIETFHYTLYLEHLMAEGLLNLKPGSFDCTYHDPCYLGRYNDIYEPPRRLLTSAGGNISEMRKHAEDSFCCGGGGGRILTEESIGKRINVERVEQAAACKQPILVSSCPFCLTMLEDGVKTTGLNEVLKTRDVVEILAERILKNPDGPADGTHNRR